MSSTQAGLLILTVVFSGALLGVLLGRLLPEHHLSSETKAVVTVSMATVATLSAMVLGLLVSTASSSFSTRNTEVVQFSRDLMRTNGFLQRFCPAAQTSRDLLRQFVTLKYRDLFPPGGGRPNLDDPRTLTVLEQLEDEVSSLKPITSRQQWLQSQALQVVAEIETTRWALAQQSSSLIALPLLEAMVLWLTVIFVSFGVFAPRNVTALAALFFAAFALAAAVKIIIDVETLQGRVRISSLPMRQALEQINH